MLKEIETLLVVQDRDRKIRALKNELKQAPLERKKLEERLATTKKQAEDVKLKGMELEVERKKLEIEATTKREQIAKYQVQKFQTRKNEEFQAIGVAVQHLEDDIRKIEDRELELMDLSEKLRPQIVEAETAARAAVDYVARQISDLDEKCTAVTGQVRDLEDVRGKVAGDLDEDLLDTYQRIFASKGEAVVALEHEVCTGCHMKVTASTNARVRAGKELVHCEQCGRILYRGVE